MFGCLRGQFYYHFRKAQAANPCTEMTGFTRLLASSNGASDALSAMMPTVAVSQLGYDKTRGFMMINRPWTMQEVRGCPAWRGGAKPGHQAAAHPAA